MDIKSLLTKLDSINNGVVTEAITQQDINAAIQGKSNEQERAKILMTLAQQNQLPGLYDPTTGYFVSAFPDTSSWPEQKARISATASKADTEALAKVGLVPSTAKTSALGGLVGTGSLFGSSEDNAKADQAVKTQSANAVAKQSSDKAAAEIPALVKQAIDILNKLKAEQTAAAPATSGASAQKAPTTVAATGNVAQDNAARQAGKTTVYKESAFSIAKALVESFDYEYLLEDQADLDKLQQIMGKLADLDPEMKNPAFAELSKSYSDFMNAKNAPAADTTPATTPDGASAQKKGYPAGTLGPGSVGAEVEALQKKLGVAVDGKFGPNTKAAVIELQKKLGVSADGIVGPQTKAAWDKNPNASAGGASGQADPNAKELPPELAKVTDKTQPYWVKGTRYEWKMRGGGRGGPATGSWEVTATPSDKMQWNSTRARSGNGYTGPDNGFDQWVAAGKPGATGIFAKNTTTPAAGASAQKTPTKENAELDAIKFLSGL